MTRTARFPGVGVQGTPLMLLLIFWSCAGNAAKPVILPLTHDPELAVRLTVGGRTAWFILDTGTGAHALARWFADSAGLTLDDSLRDGVRGRDVGGEPVSFSVVRNVAGSLPDGDTLALGSAVVADFPPQFQQKDVGGLLNPQLLAGSDRAVVLDLRVPELRLERFEDAVRRLGAHTVNDDQVQRCRKADVPVPNLLYAVLVTARDATGWLQLDTGSGETTIAAGSRLVAGLQLEEGGDPTMGVAGKPQSYSLARDLAVTFAGFHATVDAQVVEAYRGCGPDGLLGRDALGRCALVFTPGSLAMTCP